LEGWWVGEFGLVLVVGGVGAVRACESACCACEIESDDAWSERRRHD
jgi:hypothetical protein